MMQMLTLIRLVKYVFLFGLFFSFTGCGGCSKSGLYKQTSKYEIHNNNKAENSHKKTEISMRKSGGVYYVPVTINGVEMEFIFDTGASDITISTTEALFLMKHGYLEENDFLGTQQYRIADGSISEGIVINLKSVSIGNRTLYNVKGSIIDNLDAPLLLGQSALQQFGKVTIDYTNNKIIFE